MAHVPGATNVSINTSPAPAPESKTGAAAEKNSPPAHPAGEPSARSSCAGWHDLAAGGRRESKRGGASHDDFFRAGRYVVREEVTDASDGPTSGPQRNGIPRVPPIYRVHPSEPSMSRTASAGAGALPRWLVVAGSAAILFHLTAVVIPILDTPSGPWVTGDGPRTLDAPEFAHAANGLAALHTDYLRVAHSFQFV